MRGVAAKLALNQVATSAGKAMPDGSLGVGDDNSGDSGRGTGQEQSEAEQLAAAGAHVTGSSTAMEGVVALGGEGSCCKNWH